MDLAQTVTCQTRLRVGKDQVEHQIGKCQSGYQCVYSSERDINKRSMVDLGSAMVVEALLINGRYIYPCQVSRKS